MNSAATADSARTERTALVVVCLSSFIAPLMLSAVNVAIPRIAADLHADAMQMSWVPTAYLLTSAALLLPIGKLADMFGRKRLFLIGLTLVTIASMLASLSQSMEMLLACRVLQGIGASMLFGTGVAILTSVIPAERRGAAIGFSVSAVYFGLTFGPLLGGWATHYLSWRSVFLVHVPLALINLFIVATVLRGEWKNEQKQKFDFPGALFYTTSITGLMYGVSRLPDEGGIVLTVAGIAGIAAFMRFERRLESPLFDVHLFFSNRVFTFSFLAALVVYSSTFATSYLLSLYLQYLKGMEPDAAGLVLISQPLVMALCSPLMGRLSDRYEPRWIASAGLVLMATGLGLLGSLSAASPVIHAVVALLIVGLGFAMFSSPNVNAIMGSVDRRHLGSASASVGTARVLGQMFSMGIVTVVFAVLMGPVHIDPEGYPLLLDCIRTSFSVTAALCAGAILFSMARGNVHAGPRSL
jgi:EmrB/QacA subfamily drug resistance transporter